MMFINIMAMKIDEGGYPIKQEVILAKFDKDKNLLILPDNYTLPWICNQIWYKPKFNLETGMWEESLTNEEIKDYKERVKKEHEKPDELKNIIDDLTTTILMGGM